MLAGTSYSIEPYFSHVYTKSVEAGEFVVETGIVRRVADSFHYTLTTSDWKIIRGTGSVQGTAMPEVTKEVLRTANEISPENHLLMQAAIQKVVDSAVSKTINLPNTATQTQIQSLILEAHSLGIKGLTVDRNGSRDNEVISSVSGQCDL